MSEFRASFVGTCVDFPFGIQTLQTLLDTASEIDVEEFLANCHVDDCVVDSIREYPDDYTFYKNGMWYWYTHSCIEHFYRYD